jgi:hypothetical protein
MADSPSNLAQQRPPSARLLQARRLRIVRELTYLNRQTGGSPQQAAKHDRGNPRASKPQAKAA